MSQLGHLTEQILEIQSIVKKFGIRDEQNSLNNALETSRAVITEDARARAGDARAAF